MTQPNREGDILLPGELLDAVGVPSGAARFQVAYLVLAAKHCALVEAVMKLTGGEPVRVSLERVREIVDMDHSTDPRLVPMVAERPAGNGKDMLVELAEVGEIERANRRDQLRRMGPGRN